MEFTAEVAKINTSYSKKSGINKTTIVLEMDGTEKNLLDFQGLPVLVNFSQVAETGEIVENPTE